MLIDFIVKLVVLWCDNLMLCVGSFLYGEDMFVEGLKDIEWWDECGE